MGSRPVRRLRQAGGKGPPPRARPQAETGGEERAPRVAAPADVRREVSPAEDPGAFQILMCLLVPALFEAEGADLVEGEALQAAVTDLPRVLETLLEASQGVLDAA